MRWATTETITFALLVMAAGHDCGDDMMQFLVTQCHFTRSDSLLQLYRLGKVNAVVTLWNRGLYDPHLMNDIVGRDDAGTFRKIYTKGIIPKNAITKPGCRDVLLSLGHEFNMDSVLEYLEHPESMTVTSLTQMLQSGVLKRTLNINETSIGELGIVFFERMMYPAAGWVCDNGGSIDQERIDHLFTRVSIDELIGSGMMPSSECLKRLNPKRLRQVYSYQCSECDKLTTSVCTECEYTRFCSPTCVQKGSYRHRVFCMSLSDDDDEMGEIGMTLYDDDDEMGEMGEMNTDNFLRSVSISAA
jgi:hypothetical protein